MPGGGRTSNNPSGAIRAIGHFPPHGIRFDPATGTGVLFYMIGALSQLELMGAFYAQNRASTQRQSTIMGTFVSNYFDMGTNVPSIFQVPQLADNLPLGMIGAYPILIYDIVSWREI